MLDLSQALEQMNLTDIYRTFYPATEDYTFFSRPHGTFFRLYHMLSHTMNLHKFFLKIEIISNIFSDYNIMRLELNYNKKLKK